MAVEGHDWPSLIAAKNRELDRLEAIYRSLLANAGVELIEGRGIVSGPNNVRVVNERPDCRTTSDRHRWLAADTRRAGPCGTRHYVE